MWTCCGGPCQNVHWAEYEASFKKIELSVVPPRSPGDIVDAEVGAARSKSLHRSGLHPAALIYVEVVDVRAARSKLINPNVCGFDAEGKVEVVEVGAARSKLPDPTVRRLVAPIEAEVVEVGAARAASRSIPTSVTCSHSVRSRWLRLGQPAASCPIPKSVTW